MKRSKIITQQLKSLESPNVIDIKAVTTKHPKLSHKLSKTIRQGKKISQKLLATILIAVYIVRQKT